MKFPRLIHQVWIPPESGLPLPLEIQHQMHSWSDYHPGWKIKVWTLAQVHDVARQHTGPLVEQAISMCRLPAMQADIARLALLYAFGGAWVDLKLIARRCFLNEFDDVDLVLTEHFPTEDYPTPAAFRLLINSFILSVPGNPLILRALQIAVGNVLTLNSDGGVWQLTGPRCLMRAFDEYSAANTKPDFSLTVLRHEDSWDKLFSIGSGNYGGKHWSERQLDESLYQLRWT